MLTQQEIMSIFEKYKVILQGHFLLSSGLHSDRYVQCARIFEYPEVAAQLCGELVQKLKDIQVDMIIGPAIGAITMAYEMSRQMGVPNVFAEREGGKLTLRRGFTIPANANVLIVEDVVTTGKSTREIYPLIEEAGAHLVAVGCILDRSGDRVDFGAPFHSVLSIAVSTYQPDECPLCSAGSVPEAHGSRHILRG